MPIRNHWTLRRMETQIAATHLDRVLSLPIRVPTTAKVDGVVDGVVFTDVRRDAVVPEVEIEALARVRFETKSDGKKMTARAKQRVDTVAIVNYVDPVAIIAVHGLLTTKTIARRKITTANHHRTHLPIDLGKVIEGNDGIVRLPVLLHHFEKKATRQ